MQNQDLVTALMEMKRRAQMQGRPMSPNEAREVSGGYFDADANRALQSQALNFQEKHGDEELALDKYRILEMIKASKRGSRNQLFGDLLKSGVTAGWLANLK